MQIDSVLHKIFVFKINSKVSSIKLIKKNSILNFSTLSGVLFCPEKDDLVSIFDLTFYYFFISFYKIFFLY